MAKRLIPLVILLLAVLLSACRVVEEPQTTTKLPIIGDVQLKVPSVPTREYTTEQIQATTEALLNKGIPPVKTSKEVPAAALVETPKLYFLQANTPAALQDFAHEDKGCSWMGVAGQVFDKSGAPVEKIVVNVGGTINGVVVSQVGLTGMTLAYGPQSFEVQLADKAVASNGTVWVQLSDLQGNPVSPKFYINTYADCAKNLVIVNFNQVDDIYSGYFPIVSNQ